jgi:Peptidase M1 N-terminal domain
MKVTRIALRLFLWTATAATSRGRSTLAFGAASIVPKKSSTVGSGGFGSAQQCSAHSSRDPTRRCLASGRVQFPFLTSGLGSPLCSNYQSIRGGAAAAGSSTSLFSTEAVSTAVVDSTMPETKTTTTPVEIFRKDYRPLEYTVRTVSLDFSMHPGRTVVSTKMTLQRNPKLANGTNDMHFEPFVLDGDASAVQLLDIALNGRTLTADIDYVLDPIQGQLRFTGAASDIADGTIIATTCQVVPETNTQLSGLYQSDGMYCTQCEAMGFRRITYYPDRPDNMAVFDTVRIEADATLYPLLLSNGNLLEQGTIEGGDALNENRHYAVWSDPYPKPSYLFAVVAGHLDGITDTFVTQSGRTVALRLYSEPTNVHKLHYAMSALKRSMKWDEERYGVRFCCRVCVCVLCWCDSLKCIRFGRSLLVGLVASALITLVPFLCSFAVGVRFGFVQCSGGRQFQHGRHGKQESQCV